MPLIKMTEVEIDCCFTRLAEILEKHVGPRAYYLHTRIGGQDWDVRPSPEGNKTILRIARPELLTYVLLKL